MYHLANLVLHTRQCSHNFIGLEGENSDLQCYSGPLFGSLVTRQSFY